MRLPLVSRCAPALLAAFAVAGCSQAVRTAPLPSAQPVSGVRTSPAAIAQARADSSRLPYTEADIRFMSGMISHHAQAIRMAHWAPSHGAGSSVRLLAERIINAQQDEILKMQQWLIDRGQPVPEASATGMKMVMNGVEHVMLMPGMLSDEEMKRLDQAKGSEFDRLFLSFMIQHHKGAVSMVQELFGSIGAGQDEIVFKFATDVNVDQSTEIARMERMLAALTLGISSP